MKEKSSPVIDKDLKADEKARQKQLKKTNYYTITKKFPAYLNKKVLDVFSELDFLDLKYKEDGRKKIKLYKISVDNSIYIGEVNKTFTRDGLGYLVSLDGSYFEGYFSEGKNDGFGRLINSEGDIYEGTWAKEYLQGEGKIIKRSPYSCYTGNVQDSLPEGTGKLEMHDKSMYEGQFHLGKKHGYGVLLFGDGSKYEGEFSNDKRTGKGTFYFKDGSNVTGLWDKGNVVGSAVMNFGDGKVYEGELINYEADGKGILTYPNGRVFDGFWKNGRKHGLGVEISENGEKIEGEWRNGKLMVKVKEVKVKKPKKNNGELAENMKELEEKVDEIRKKGFKEKKTDKAHVTNMINVHYAIENLNKHKFEEEKIKRTAERLKDRDQRHFNMQAESLRAKEHHKNHCRKISAILNTIKITESISGFQKILLIREDLGDFDYHDEDCFASDSTNFIEDWTEIRPKTFYRGEARGEIPSGLGILLSKKKIYEGNFADGLLEGYCREIAANYHYIGFWSEGNKSGFGVKSKKESVYVGEFSNNLQEGEGYLKTAEATYRGQWKNGKQHGTGTLRYSNGKVYKGEFQEGVIKGFGSVVWPSGKSYAGYWENGEILEKKSDFHNSDKPSEISKLNENAQIDLEVEGDALDIIDRLLKIEAEDN